ncbi:MAG TPA: hypothetical protein VGB26_09980, partial [Nitrospiria bacterium]
GAWISAFPCLQVPAGQTGNDEIYPLTSTMSQKLNPGFLPAGQAGPIKPFGNDELDFAGTSNTSKASTTE